MRPILTLSMVSATVLILSGCATTHHRQTAAAAPTVVVAKKPAHKHGPPPHAPAHGYRHKHHKDGVVLVYDTKLKAYLVAGYRDHYYDDGVYFRWSEQGWEMAASWSSEWGRISIERVPSGIRRLHR